MSILPNDAARETGSWGIGRIRGVIPGAVLIDYGSGDRRWTPVTKLEWLRHVTRWAPEYF